MTDEEVAAEDELEFDVVAHFRSRDWNRIRVRPDLSADVIAAAEVGFDAVAAVVALAGIVPLRPGDPALLLHAA